MLLNENVPATIDRWLVLHFCLFLLFLLISPTKEKKEKRRKERKKREEKRREKKREEEKRREEKKRKEEVPNVQMYSHTK